MPLHFAVLVYTTHQLGVFTALQRQYALFCDAVKVRARRSLICFRPHTSAD